MTREEETGEKTGEDKTREDKRDTERWRGKQLRKATKEHNVTFCYLLSHLSLAKGAKLSLARWSFEKYSNRCKTICLPTLVSYSYVLNRKEEGEEREREKTG